MRLNTNSCITRAFFLFNIIFLLCKGENLVSKQAIQIQENNEQEERRRLKQIQI